MYLSKSNIFAHSALSIGLLFFTQSIFAQQFNPPEQISHSGHVYKLAYKKTSPNGQAIYEYTTNEEPIEKWTTLVTLNYAKAQKVTPLRWSEAMKLSLDRETPKPNYSIYVKEENGYANIIYEPDINNPTYESDVHKSFHLEECGGSLVYQFAVKYPKSADQSEAGKLATLTSIAKENVQISTDMAHSEWSPSCN